MVLFSFVNFWTLVWVEGEGTKIEEIANFHAGCQIESNLCLYFNIMLVYENLNYVGGVIKFEK